MNDSGLRLTFFGRPYFGTRKRPWWLNKCWKLQGWLVLLLMIVMIVGLPIACVMLAAAGKPALMIVTFALVYPISYFVVEYGNVTS